MMQTLWTQAGSAITAALSAIGGPTTPGANILPNGGFEQPASVSWQVATGWTEGSANNFAGTLPNDVEVVVQSSQTDGGSFALECGFVPGYSFATYHGGAACAINATGIPVIPGETYTITGDMLSTQPAGVGWNTSLTVLFTVPGVSVTSQGQYIPGSDIVGTPQHLHWPVPAGNGAWQAGSWTVTAPAGAALMFVMPGVLVSTTETVGTGWTATFDNLAVALSTPLQPYGRMAGSANLGAPVRFSSLPKFSDMGWIEGQKCFAAAFTLEEV